MIRVRARVRARGVCICGLWVVADGLLGGAGVSEFVMVRTLELAQEAHDHLNSRPVDAYGAGNAIRAIGRLWGVHS